VACDGDSGSLRRNLNCAVDGEELVVVGNPFSPFLNSWFPNPYVHVWSEKSYLKSLRPYSSANKAKALPVLWSLSGADKEGLFGRGCC